MTENAENKLGLKLILLYIPVAYFTYLFHEFGHWVVGEILGNDMAYGLNLVSPKNWHYIMSLCELNQEKCQQQGNNRYNHNEIAEFPHILFRIAGDVAGDDPYHREENQNGSNHCIAR